MEITLPTLIDMYAATKQIEGKSPRTIKWYVATLNTFAEYVGNTRLVDVSINQGRAFIASLQQREVRYSDHPLRTPIEGGLAPITVLGYVRALKTFGGWLHEEGYANKNPFEKLKRPKVPDHMIEIFSDQEIDSLLKVINPKCILGSRLQVIVLLLLDTGIRASELCSLKFKDTHLDENYVKVLGKGNKERIVPFGTTTKKALIRYVHTFRPEPPYPDIEELVLTVDGLPLKYQGLFSALKRLGRRAGVTRIHPHLFRHTFAVRYLMNGGDIMTLKLMLGHTTLEVTQLYLHLAKSHVRMQHNKFSPVDRLEITRRR